MAVAAPSTFGSFSSAVRLGFLEVRPVEEQRIVKQWGIKFRQIERRYEPKLESIADYTKFLSDSLLEGISIPTRFDRQRLQSILFTRLNDSLNRDEELKKELEDLLTHREKEGGFKRTYRFVQLMQRKQHETYEKSARNVAALLFQSDLPFALLNDFLMFERSYSVFLDIMEDRIRHYVRRLSHPDVQSTLKRTQRYLNDARQELGPLIDHFDAAVFALLRVQILMDICNSEKYDEILKSKPMTLSKMDRQGLDQLVEKYREQLASFRLLLVEKRPRAFTQKIDTQDSTTKMLQSLIRTTTSG